MKNLRWTTNFLDIKGNAYEVKIYEEGYAGSPAEVDCTATPAVIEWQEKGLLEPVQGSSLTLQLISDEDRMFYDSLYSALPFALRCDVYRNGSLYWSGTLDPELYEEPYATEKGYEVNAVFVDFAPLERVDWDGEGFVTMQDIVARAIEASQLASMPLQLMISTRQYADTAMDLSAIKIDASNFYDEDDAPMTLREVLEETLRPFGLKMTQKGGAIVISDTNALAESTPQAIRWDSTDQTIGAAETYNDATLTYSPYAKSTIKEATLEHDDALPDAQKLLYMTSYDWSNAADGFTLCHGAMDADKLPMEILDSRIEAFRIDSEYSGSDCAGFIAHADGHSKANYNTAIVAGPLKAMSDGYLASSPILKMDCGFIGPDSAHRLKVSLDLLCDVRYNPFESASNYNEEGNYSKMENWCNFAYVPIALNLYGVNGSTYHYANDSVMRGSTYNAQGSWVTGAGSVGSAWLAWYDSSNRKSKTGLGGWQTNKQCIGYDRSSLPDKFAKGIDGEKMPFPPVAGRLELVIGSGIYQYDYGREEKNIYPRLRWLAYKDARVEMVKANGNEIELQDQVLTAWITKGAKETLEITTIAGTGKYMPTARGALRGASLERLSTFWRGGVYDTLERLLLGTAFSLYAGRKQTLSGTARLLPSHTALTDDATSGIFAVTSEQQDLRLATSTITAVEIQADCYEGIEFEE